MIIATYNPFSSMCPAVVTKDLRASRRHSFLMRWMLVMVVGQVQLTQLLDLVFIDTRVNPIIQLVLKDIPFTVISVVKPLSDISAHVPQQCIGNEVPYEHFFYFIHGRFPLFASPDTKTRGYVTE